MCLGVPWCGFSALRQTLFDAGIVTVKSILELAGPNFGDARRLADHLQIRSIRTVARLLEGRCSTFSLDELRLVEHYCAGMTDPDATDSFLSLIISR